MANTPTPAGSLILAHFVEQQLEGWTFSNDSWPLHISLVPWFTVTDEEAIIRSLERVTAQTMPIRLGVGEIEEFGEKHNIPVNIISNQRPIRAFHEKLVETLSEADISYVEDRFMGEDYVAHISHNQADGRHSNPGEETVINNFFIVRLLPDNTCRVEQEFILKHNY